MKTLFQLLSVLGLFAVIVPPVLYLTDFLDKGPMQGWMLVGTVLWFAAAPIAARIAPRPVEK